MRHLLIVWILVFPLIAAAQLISSESQVGKGGQRYARIINNTNYKLSCTIIDVDNGGKHIFMVYGNDVSQWYPVSDAFDWSCGCGAGNNLQSCIE